jgi:hypothetical protein
MSGELTIRAVTLTIGAILLDGKHISVTVYDQMPTATYSTADYEHFTPHWLVRRCPSTCVRDQRLAERYRREGRLSAWRDYRVVPHMHIIASTPEEDGPTVFTVPLSFKDAAEFTDYTGHEDIRAEHADVLMKWWNTPQGYVGVGR